MKKQSINESKNKLFGLMQKVNGLVLTEGNSYLKDNGMVKRALSAANLQAYASEFDDFDVAEAIAVYVYDYNDNTNEINQFKGLLKLARFNPSPMFKYDYEELSEPAKMVYDALVGFYEKESEPQPEVVAEPEMEESYESDQIQSVVAPESEFGYQLLISNGSTGKKTNYMRLTKQQLLKIIEILKEEEPEEEF